MYFPSCLRRGACAAGGVVGACPPDPHFERGSPVSEVAADRDPPAGARNGFGSVIEHKSTLDKDLLTMVDSPASVPHRAYRVSWMI
jgi:hypothetical protein